jgi:hypothetical protein
VSAAKEARATLKEGGNIELNRWLETVDRFPGKRSM